jgi:TAFII55 protein conserved region
MDNDLIIVDDVEAVDVQASPSKFTGTADPDPFYAEHSRPKNAAERIMASSSQRRSTSKTPVHPSMETSERTTRSATAKSKPQPKLKLKLSEKAAAQAPGMSFLGQYDRELDSDDEDLAFEEQFILRMPAGEDCERLKKMVAAREVANDVWFKFKGEEIFLLSSTLALNRSCRLSPCGVSHWQFYVFLKARRSTMYHRISEDTRQQTNVQSRRHMSGRAVCPTKSTRELTLPYRCW